MMWTPLPSMRFIMAAKRGRPSTSSAPDTAASWRSAPSAKAVGAALRYMYERTGIRIEIEGHRVYSIGFRLAYPEAVATPASAG